MAASSPAAAGSPRKARDPDDRADPVLQLERAAFENVVVVVVAPPGVELLAQGDHGGGLVVVVRREQVADLTDLLGVGEGRIVDDLLDPPQHPHDRGIDGLEQTGQPVVALVAPRVAVVLMLALAGVLVRPQGGQQRVHQVVLRAVELVGDEGDDVKVAIRVGAAGELEDLRPDHAARVVAHPLAAEPQGGQDADQPLVHAFRSSRSFVRCRISLVLVDCDSFLSRVRRYRLVRPGSAPSAAGVA